MSPVSPIPLGACKTMANEEEINFLRDFRERIERYLFLGLRRIRMTYSPILDSGRCGVA